MKSITKTILKVLIRLIVFPGVLLLTSFAAIRNTIYTNWQWLRHGGELQIWDDTFNPETLRGMIKNGTSDEFRKQFIEISYNQAVSTQKVGEILTDMSETIKILANRSNAETTQQTDKLKKEIQLTNPKLIVRKGQFRNATYLIDAPEEPDAVDGSDDTIEEQWSNYERKLTKAPAWEIANEEIILYYLCPCRNCRTNECSTKLDIGKLYDIPSALTYQLNKPADGYALFEISTTK